MRGNGCDCKGVMGGVIFVGRNSSVSYRGGSYSSLPLMKWYRPIDTHGSMSNLGYDIVL